MIRDKVSSTLSGAGLSPIFISREVNSKQSGRWYACGYKSARDSILMRQSACLPIYKHAGKYQLDALNCQRPVC